MGKAQSLKITILGAGPSGLCCAWNLLQDGHRVTVIEKSAVCGGQSITFGMSGYSYDLGPHNIHSQRGNVIKFLEEKLGGDFVKHNFRAQIYFRGKMIKYPFVGIDVLSSVSPLVVALCIISFIWARFSSFFIPRFRDGGNYKTWIINRFGYKFYMIYFAPYSQKVWKIPPDEISDIVAKKRIAISGIIEIIHSVLFKKQRYHPENSYLIDSYYPQRGIGSISDFFVNGIIQNQGNIIMGGDIQRIVVENSRVKRVYYSHDGKMEYLDFADDSGEKVLSTIPVNEMVIKLEGDIPMHVKEAARGLDFTSEIFLYLNLRKPDGLGVPLLYFSEPEFPFNRIYDVGLFSRKMVPPGKNALCLEISCRYNDEVWNMGEEALFNQCIEPLERHNLLRREDVESYHTRRMEHAYPCFRIGYERKLETIFSYLSSISNLISFGRQGLFTYANVDDAIWMGFEVAKAIPYLERIKLSIKDLFPEYISF